MPKFGDPNRSDPVFASTCLECGKPVFGSHKGQPRKFCDKAPGRKKSLCAKRYSLRQSRTPEYYKEQYWKLKADPRTRERALRGQRQKARKVRAHNKRIGRERYQMIDAAVPRHFLRDTRMEIVAKACLLYAEGYIVEDCVKLATKKVNKGNELQNYKSKDIDDCFWLADEPQEVEDYL